MKISEISVYSHQIPVVHGRYRMSVGELTTLETTLVRIVTDDGLTGWGETCPVGPVYQPHHAAGAQAALTELAPRLIGEDPTRILSLHRRMNALLDGHEYAKAALDIAAHDITGKHFQVRVADLLGGAETERVPSYYALAIGEPDEVAEQAVRRADEGYPRLQLKAGSRPVEIDIETVRKVWERVGGRVQLAVDANRSLTARDVLRLSRECRDIPFVIEQPTRTMDELPGIRDRIEHAVYLDETTVDVNAVLRAVGSHLCEGFGLKVTRLGGLLPMTTVRGICEARSLPHTCDDAWGGDIIAAACTHLGATVSPRLNEGVWIAQPYLGGHYGPDCDIDVVAGHIALPPGPGLGITPDESQFGTPVAAFG
ncbi:mandelate racemase/muconate lactonizing enzyme family protein [Sciscionella sediminilitoris]|uniref:mandelate racemase/muconate lactonizing enzyme family protein n=1 Tax=Sciscionella sediminilitoris TaxID=1445613 RepID=UPI0004DEE302|nr:mandelate racemase/muconate lactonizing enzyme family protein [Sciscionella sp. SE31]